MSIVPIWSPYPVKYSSATISLITFADCIESKSFSKWNRNAYWLPSYRILLQMEFWTVWFIIWRVWSLS